MSVSATLIKPVDEAIEIVEFTRAQAHAKTLEASQEVKAVAQRRVSGYSNEVNILGDISQMTWTPEHTYSLADDRSWVLSFDGANPLKKGYQLVVALVECDGWELDAVAEKRPVDFQITTVKYEVVVMVRKNLVRRIMKSIKGRDFSRTRKVYDVTSLKGYWK
jgi:hypothetical protein